MTFCLIHLPDFICLFRIVTSIIALCLGPHPITPHLFTAALMSDLFDGWIFRKYVRNHPAWHPWNPLPITLDPLSDFVLIICGSIFICRYLLHFAIILTLCVLTIIIGIGSILNTLPFLIQPHSALLYTVCMTTLTHLACGLMILAPITAWYLCYPTFWKLYAIGTLYMFYSTFTIIGDPKRLIRHPPADFLTL